MERAIQQAASQPIVTVWSGLAVPDSHKLGHVSAKAGWYPDPGGGQGLFRYWDGKAWSAATSPNPKSPPPTQGVIGTSPQQPAGAPVGVGQGGYGTGYGTGGYGAGGYGQTGPAGPAGVGGYGQQGTAYANYQEIQKKKSPIGWWIGGAALVVAIIVIAVIAIRAIGGEIGVTGQPTSGPASQDVCPPEKAETADPNAHPNDGRVHGGPISYPELGSPWGPPQPDNRVPFGSDVRNQVVPVEVNYDNQGTDWVASVLVGELQAGDGFFTPEQGSEIVVRCILGKFYGNNPVQSDVKVNQATQVDGHEAWIVESQLSFDIEGLKTKGELLIVVIVCGRGALRAVLRLDPRHHSRAGAAGP